MDSATVAVVNYLGRSFVVDRVRSTLLFCRLEQRAEVDRVHVKEKSACSTDAIRRWEEVGEFGRMKR